MLKALLLQFGLNRLQYFGRMIGCFGHLAPMFFHLPVGPYPYGRTNHALGDLTVHFLLPESLVLGHHLFFRVAQQYKGNIVLFNEFLMRCFTVRGDSQNYGIEFSEFAIYVTESLGFLGSPRRVIFGIEVNDDIFTFEILQ